MSRYRTTLCEDCIYFKCNQRKSCSKFDSFVNGCYLSCLCLKPKPYLKDATIINPFGCTLIDIDIVNQLEHTRTIEII